jgi:hypothetical protein
VLAVISILVLIGEVVVNESMADMNFKRKDGFKSNLLKNAPSLHDKKVTYEISKKKDRRMDVLHQKRSCATGNQLLEVSQNWQLMSESTFVL